MPGLRGSTTLEIEGERGGVHMGASRIVCTTASGAILRLEKAGLTPERAEILDRDGSGRLARAMMLAFNQEFAVMNKADNTEGSYKRAYQRRAQFIRWYKEKKLGKINVPQLLVTDEEYEAALAKNEDYFYIHITSRDKYCAFMVAMGQSDHWTVVHNDRNKIGWDFKATGYWIKAEVAPNCPRLKTPWNTLSTTIHLLSLEEYVVIWHFLKSSGTVLDGPTWCWLRTRYNGSGALNADEGDGEVLVSRSDVGVLSEAFDCSGGRSAEVVRNL